MSTDAAVAERGVATAPRTIRTSIPSRLDRLPWARFHWRVVIGLGAVWILDGLEVTNVGSVASRLTEHGSGISISVGQIGWAASFYVLGACLGALFFGQLTDRFGRKKLFMITLGVYLAATALTAVSTTFWMFWIFRFLTGAGIGGEYSAINSAIDELIPARARGNVDLVINGTYWAGSAAAAGLALFFLDTAIFPLNVGWRLAFALGVVLGTVVLLVRRNVPESPRWMFIHGRDQEAERLVDGIEKEVEAETGQSLAVVHRSLEVQPREAIPFRWIARTAFKKYPRRSALALALFVGQAFIYNGITFNLGTLMATFFGVSSSFVPVFLVLYALGNLAGPLTIGRLFDTVGRRPMITLTYGGSAAVGVLLALLFWHGGVLGAWTFIFIVMATFFLASAGASAAYLTASEIFPMEVRALAIAFFYAVGTAVGGITGPALFGSLISSGRRSEVAIGFLIGSAVMAIGALAEFRWGIAAEGQQLEDVAVPLTAVNGGVDAAMGSIDAQMEPAERHQMVAGQVRRMAALERARAAGLRSEAHAQLAGWAEGDKNARARADAGLDLAEVAERLARAYDELAAHRDQLADAARAESEPAAEAARRRADAAEERAWSHQQEAHALESEDERDRERHDELGEAALERARALEQEALAVEARARASSDGSPNGRASVDGARAQMHESWAQMHRMRGEGHAQRADGNERDADESFRRADVLAERARAAAFEAESGERRAEADRELSDEEAADAARRATAEEQEQRQEFERRVNERLQRRAHRRRGLRRYRPGPGRYTSWVPSIGAPAPPPEEALDREITSIETALDEHGPMERDELARLVGARYWGPGVFSEALRQAIDEGGARRLSRNVYGPGNRPESS